MLEICLLQILNFTCAHEYRIQITISLSGSSNTEVRAQDIFPLYALFAKPISDVLYDGVGLSFFNLRNWNICPPNGPFLIFDMALQHSPVYQFTRAFLLTCFDESGRNRHTEATFIIQDLKTLANIILVSCGILFILWDYLCTVFLLFHQI